MDKALTEIISEKHFELVILDENFTFEGKYVKIKGGFMMIVFVNLANEMN
jgi:hypothetical protein